MAIKVLVVDDEKDIVELVRYHLHHAVAGIKINGDLERIGDQAVSIALRARSLITQPQVKPLIDIPRMAVLSQEMVRKSLDAFVPRDPDLARTLIETDDQVDSLRDQVFRELLTYMMSDPVTILRALELILVSRHLERIADHATNIAEDVIYIVRGEDVRERGDKELRKGAPSARSEERKYAFPLILFGVRSSRPASRACAYCEEAWVYILRARALTWKPGQSRMCSS